MDINTSLTIVASVSMITAGIAVSCGSSAAAFSEANIAKEAMHSLTVQPDEASDISKTCFITMAMIESSAIYCLVISMILIFANPFWTTLLKRAS